MKGSPAKMGMIKGTAGHRSALKAMEEKAAMKAMEKAAAMKAMKKDSPMDFNAKLKQASADGKLSGKFKEAVDASPAKFERKSKKETPEGYKKASKRLSEIKERFDESKPAKTKKSAKEAYDALKKGLKDRSKEMEGKTPGTGMRKLSAADRKKLEEMSSKKSPAKAMKKSPMKEDDIAYGGTVSWKEGMKKSGNRLNNLVAARAKYKKGTAEYNEIQNEINKNLGSKVRRTTKDESGKEVLPKNTKKTTIVDDKGTEDKSDDTTKTETKVKGLGRKKDKTLTFTEKEAEKAKLAKLKEQKKGAETKLEKLEAKKKIANVKSGADDAKTGTVFSRAYNKLKAKNISKKIEKEKNKNKS